MEDFVKIPLLSNFIKIDIRSIVNNSRIPVCEEYLPSFEKIKDPNITILFFIYICGLTLDSTSRDGLVNLRHIGLKKTDSIFILEEDISHLFEYIPFICDTDIKARISDIVWIKAKNRVRIAAAHIAIKAYINSAKKISKYNKFYAAQRLFRAADIALKIKKFNKKSIVWRAILNWIQNEINQNPQDDDIGILEFALRKKIGNAKHIIKRCIAISEIFRRQHNYTSEQNLLQIAIKNIAKLPWKTNSLLNYLQRRMLSSIEEQAKSYGPIGEATFLKTAITKARAYKLTEEVTRLHKMLLNVQKNIENKMNTVRFSVDATHMLSKIDSLISGKNIHESIRALESIIPILNKDKEILYTIERCKKCICSSIISSDIVNAKGKTIATLPPLKFDNPQEELENIADRAFHHIALFYIPVYGEFICYALEKITSEHSKEEISNEIENILNDNFFIPNDHYNFFKNGLMHGIYNDIAIGNALLVPQLENSIRHRLELSGHITSKINYRQIQEEQDLNKLLDNKFVIEMLSSDICFTLKAIFTEKAGLNFRNHLAHGLLTYSEQSSSSAYYAWGIIFKIILLFSRLKLQSC